MEEVKFENLKISICTPILISSPPFFVIYKKVTEALRKHIRLDFLLFPLPFHQYQVKYAYPRFSKILWKHYGSSGSI